jgi:hypothetical protein
MFKPILHNPPFLIVVDNSLKNYIINIPKAGDSDYTLMKL